MKENRTVLVCNFAAAGLWALACVLYFLSGNKRNGILFLCLAVSQLLLGLMNLAAYRKAKAKKAPPPLKGMSNHGDD